MTTKPHSLPLAAFPLMAEMDNPNQASTSNKPKRGVCHRSLATIVLAIIGLSIPGVLAIYAVATGFGPRSTVENGLHAAMAVVYIPGAFIALLFGDLLARDDDPVHRWNAFLFYAGTLISWTLLGAAIGYVVDLMRCRKPPTRHGGSAQSPPGGAGRESAIN
jgi:hypothetical protein